MSRGPKAVALALSEEEQGEVQRLRIILDCAEPGATNLGVAMALGVSPPDGGLWRGSLRRQRLEGLVDGAAVRRPSPYRRRGGRASRHPSPWKKLRARPRAGAPARWRSGAGLSQSAGSRIWRAFGSATASDETFSVSHKNPDSPSSLAVAASVQREFCEVHLSSRPIPRSSRRCATWSASTWIRSTALWSCASMRSPRSRWCSARRRPTRCGRAERTTHDYRRHGTLDLFAALDVKAGTIHRPMRAPPSAAPSSARSWIRSSNPLRRIWR